MQKIAVLGTGYVGLVAGVLFAYVGNKVICIDRNDYKVKALSQGEVPIYEPGLKERLAHALEQGNISLTMDVIGAVKESDIIFLAVGTPSNQHGDFDGTGINAAAAQVGKGLQGQHGKKFVIVKSTVDVALFNEIKESVLKQLSKADLQHLHIEFISNPEFLAEGRAVTDFEKPDRIVIGATSQEAREAMTELYRPFTIGNKLLFVKPESAILGKLASNGMLASRVAYINEVARLSDYMHADYAEVRHIMATDSRIGSAFLHASPGFGGSCFGKDTRDMTAQARHAALTLPVVSSIGASNTTHKQYVAAVIAKQLGQLKGKTIAVWGLAYKANTDDVRESPAIDVVKELMQHGAKIRAHDPKAVPKGRKELGDAVTYCEDKYEAAKDADALVILTEWSEYKSPDFEKLHSLSQKVIFDVRNILEPTVVAREGFTHYGIGRGFTKPHN